MGKKLEAAGAGVDSSSTTGGLPIALHETVVLEADVLGKSLLECVSAAGLGDDLGKRLPASLLPADAGRVVLQYFRQLTGSEKMAQMLFEHLVSSGGEDFVFDRVGGDRLFNLGVITGRTGQAIVHRVVRTRDTTSEVLVAKVPHSRQEGAESNPHARLDLEGEILQRLEPVSIAPAWRGNGKRVDTSGERPYLLMEYINGWDVGDLSDALGKLRETASQRMQIGVERTVGHFLAQMLQAHVLVRRRGVLHRDIKPRNIHIRDSGQMVMLDFGLGYISDQSPDDTALTRTGQFIGTPEYAAPEAVRPGKRDKAQPEADLFSIGATAHQLLTGHSPVEGQSLLGTVSAVEQWDGKLPRLDDVHARALRSVLVQLLSKDSTKREDPNTHLLALRSGGVVQWRKQQLLGMNPLMLPMPRNGQSMGPDQLVAFWSERFSPPVISRRTLLAAAVLLGAAIVDHQTHVIRNRVFGVTDEDDWLDMAPSAEAPRPPAPFAVRYRVGQSASGEPMFVGAEEVHLDVGEESSVIPGSAIAVVHDQDGRVGALLHPISTVEIDHLRHAYRIQNTVHATQSQCSIDYVAPDGAMAIVIPHVGLLCQDPDGGLAAVWDVYWSNAERSSSPPPEDVVAFFAQHFPADFASRFSDGDTFPDAFTETDMPVGAPAKMVAERWWATLRKVCKLNGQH